MATTRWSPAEIDPGARRGTRARRRGLDDRDDGARRSTGYGRVVRAPDGTVERVVETKTPGDATELELHIREVNAGCSRSRAGAARCRLRQVSSDNAQGEHYLPRRAADHSRGTSGRCSRMRSTTRGRARRQRPVGLAAVRASRPAADPDRRRWLAGVTIVDPVATVIDVDVRIGAGHGDRALLLPPRHDLDRAGLDGRPVDDADRRRRVGDGAMSSIRTCRGRDRGSGVSVGPFAYLRPGTRSCAGLEGGHVRGGQEL